MLGEAALTGTLGGIVGAALGMAAVAAEAAFVVLIGVVPGFVVTMPSLAGIASGLAESVGRSVAMQLDTTNVAGTVGVLHPAGSRKQRANHVALDPHRAPTQPRRINLEPRKERPTSHMALGANQGLLPRATQMAGLVGSLDARLSQ